MARIRSLFYICSFLVFRPLSYILPFRFYLLLIRVLSIFSASFYFRRRAAAGKALQAVQGLAPDKADKAITEGLRNVSLFGFLDFIADKWTPGRAEKYARIEGKENLEKAISGGKGVLLTYVHSNTFNVALPCTGHIKEIYPLVVLESKGWLSGIHAKIRGDLWESVPNLEFTYLDREENASLKIKHLLRRGDVVAITADGLHTTKFVSVPFFNTVLQLPMGVFKLSTLFRAPIVPLFSGFDWGEGRFRISLGKPILKDTPVETANAFSAQFQAHLKKYPSDWSGWWRMTPVKDEKGAVVYNLYSVR